MSGYSTNAYHLLVAMEEIGILCLDSKPVAY